MNQPTALGVRIYAGGFTEGMRQHLQVLGHLEVSNFGCPTALANLKLPLGIKIDKELRWDGPKVDVIYGNPPCVAFSQLGHKQYMEHPSVADIRAYARFGISMRPKVWVWECVRQVLTQGRPLVDEIVKWWAEAGYHCYIFLTDANLHGAAQRRKRFHLIASVVQLTFPVPTPAEAGSACRMVLEAMKPEMDVKNLQVRKYLQWMEPYSVPGHALRKVWFWLHGLKSSEPKPAHLRFCPPFCIQRLHPDRPSCTLTGGPDFVHPWEWRVLSPGEMAALSGFRSDWVWLGPVVERYKQVTFGVCPPVGAYLGKVFADGILVDKRVQAQGLEIIDLMHLADSRWDHVELPPFPEQWVGLLKDKVNANNS